MTPPPEGIGAGVGAVLTAGALALFDRYFRKRNGRTEANVDLFNANERIRKELWDRVSTLETRVIALEKELLNSREVLVKYEAELLGIKAIILGCPNIKNCPVRDLVKTNGSK